MRNVLRFGLACIAVMGAIALAPPATASAAGLEVTDEINGGHCNPCIVHAVGRTRVFLMGTVLISECQDEWTARIYEDGSGAIYQYSSSNYPGSMISCLYQKCNGVGESEAEGLWEVYSGAEIGPAFAQLPVRVCLDAKAAPNNAGLHCDIEAFFPTTSHGGSISAVNWCAGNLALISSDWQREGFGCACGHDVIEVAHI